MEVEKYTKEEPISPEVAEQVISLFARNYPDSHDVEEREKDIDARSTKEQLDAMLEDGKVLFVIKDVHEKVMGILEMNEVDAGEGIYMQLVWIMIDELAQGQGLATPLHRAFEDEAAQRARNHEKPSCQLLSVHKENDVAIKVYQKWGYEGGEPRDTGKIFMYKDL